MRREFLRVSDVDIARTVMQINNHFSNLELCSFDYVPVKSFKVSIAISRRWEIWKIDEFDTFLFEILLFYFGHTIMYSQFGF